MNKGLNKGAARPLTWLWLLAWLILSSFSLPFLLPWPPAWAGETLVNSEVTVDVSGKDSADARTQAMLKGQADALASLLGKLTTAEQAQALISKLNDAKIGAMVRGTEVLEEKISSNRYRARLMVTFDGDAIAALVGKTSPAAGAPEQPGVRSFLVIPVYEEGGPPSLWGDSTNPWLPIWRQAGLETPSGDIVVPYGDNKDMTAIDASTAAAANYAALEPLSVRYGASDIVILQAKLVSSPDMELTVVRHRMNRTQNEVSLLTYRADPQETRETLLARAARDIAGHLEHSKIAELENTKIVGGGEHNSLMVLASISTLSSWTQLRSKLSALPMVDRLEVLAISPQQVDMIVHYRGAPDSLADGIAAQNLRLVKNPRYWVVSHD